MHVLIQCDCIPCPPLLYAFKAFFHCYSKVFVQYITRWAWLIISYSIWKSYPFAEQSWPTTGIEYFHHILMVSILNFSSLGTTVVSCSLLSNLSDIHLPEMLRGMWVPRTCSSCLDVDLDVHFCSNAHCQFLNVIYSLAYSSGNNSCFSLCMNLLCLQNIHPSSCILWASLWFTFAETESCNCLKESFV